MFKQHTIKLVLVTVLVIFCVANLSAFRLPNLRGVAGAAAEAQAAAAVEDSSGTTMEWPEEERLARFGVSGLRQPAGVEEMNMIRAGNTLALNWEGGSKAQFEYLVDQLRAKPGFMALTEETTDKGITALFMSMDPRVSATVIYVFEGSIVTLNLQNM
jgi:hypothetical protein